MLVARSLTLDLLAQWTGTPSSGRVLMQVCDRCGGCHGAPQPTEEGLHVAWSHSRGWIAAGVSAHPIGIDIESAQGPWRNWPLGALAASALTASETEVVLSATSPHRAFMTAWTAKEALTKAGVLTLDTFQSECVLGEGGLVLREVRGLRLAVHSDVDYTVAIASAEDVEWFAHTV